jgi:hypothetical protein
MNGLGYPSLAYAPPENADLSHNSREARRARCRDYGRRRRQTEEFDMSTQVPPEPMTNRAQHEAPHESGWVGGLTMFAGVMMLIVGILQAFDGIAALVNDKVYVTTPNYIYAFDLTGWGWIHLLLGVLVAVVGVAIMQGQTWGRWVGIGLVGLSLIANFLFIPYYPIWSLVIIALEVAVIAALATHRPANV